MPASADELDDRRAQNAANQAAVDAALEALQTELEHNDAALVQAYAELQGIQAQIPVAEQQLATAEETLARLQREAQLIAERLTVAETEESTITTQIATNTERADQTRIAIGQMARDAYKGNMTQSSLSAVLDAKSSDEFVEQSALASTALRTQTQALRELEQINGVNRNRQVRLTAVREEITALKAEADAKVVEAEAARAAAEARKLELEDLQAQATAKAAEIEAAKASMLAQEQALASQQAALEADLQAIVAAQEQKRREEAAAAAAAAAAAGRPAPAPPQGSTAARPFINPSSVNPMVVTSDYGQRFHPILHYWRLHAGTDIRTWCGTPLYAGASGTVEWARSRSGFGNQVMINHGYWQGSSLMSSYNHMTSFAVSGGQHVSQGQLIGYAGNTGTSAACHLHFEVYVNGSTVNPRPLING
ncbi:peptidoglycan DD-metalloendopeptidase family protein [Actinotalea ferrariae]|uniref:M23 family metallopeptidase n=1 Tax=Actinotalea ferrariae TaxID=1386098 RepID=UPI001C8B8E7D|nr:M23 family metallopeptidase [Actinotalea ferrariae]MBX9243554.1 peptidoglycan DD-metalloendopeptidase family protein [Actinotalea ferrariae]